MNVLNTVANARTWLSSFAGPCAYLAGFALLAGLLLGAWGMRHWDKGEIAEAKANVVREQANFANLKAEIATQRAEAADQASRMRQEAQETINQWLGSLHADIVKIPAQVAAQVTPEFTAAFRSQNHAANLDCLDLPLPDQSLRMLNRPGSAAP